MRRLGHWAWSAAAWWVLVAAALGQGAGVEVPVRTVTAGEYRAQVERVRAVVRGCAEDVRGCEAGRVGEDDRVAEGGYEVHWGWVREALEAARKDGAAKPDGVKTGDRAGLMAEVLARLDGEGREAGAAGDEAGFARARAGADAVLARREFRGVAEQDYWQMVLTRVARWLERVFEGAAALGRYASWMGTALEWGFVLGVGVGAVLWGLRVMRRQRLAIAMEGPAKMRDWEEASRAWADAAKAAAEGGDWREAVHALYWASVVELEGRRIWRQNRERTPREYLRLLEAGSKYARPVRGLTQMLERIWYGLGAAERGDYERALAWYDEVRAA